MDVPVAFRIGVVVAGFALMVAAELLDNVHNGKPAATGARQADTFYDDAKVFTMRVGGAVAIGIGLLFFVAAHKGTIF